MHHRIVTQLSDIALPNVFNPYADLCSSCDEPNSAEIRCENLSELINAASACNLDAIWFGRDLGYLGGRRTGIALTDEIHLSSYEQMFPGLRLSKATKGNPLRERTATMLWETLSKIEGKIFLWNIFPLHPYNHGDPRSNRCHTRHERDATLFILKQIVDELSPKRLIAIGNDAASGLSEIGYSVLKVRHPSYGGKSDFVRGVSSIYKLRMRR